MPFKVKHSKDWTTTPEQVGGTWDGRLLPSAADGSLSLSKFLKARLPSRQVGSSEPQPRTHFLFTVALSSISSHCSAASAHDCRSARTPNTCDGVWS